MAGRMTPTAFNSHDISSASVYIAKFLRDSAIGDVFESQQVTAEVTGNFPQYVLGQPQGRVLVLRIELNPKTYANLKQLKQWFNARNDEVTLAATNENSDSLTLTVKSLGLSPVDGFDGYWDAKLWASMPIWRNATAADTTENVAADSAAWSVTNDGSDSVKPRITITPKAQKTAGNGPLSMRRVVVANRSNKALLDGNGNPWPIDITNGGFDATTKIKAENMHPQGYDMHVLVDGVEVNRYLSNWGAGFGNASASSFHIISTTTGYMAQRFRTTGCSSNEQNTINEAGFYIKKTGAPTGTLTYKIRADSGGAPGAVVSNGTSPATANVSTLTTSLTYLAATYSSKPVLNANTWYWLEVDPSGITFSGGSLSIGKRQATVTNQEFVGIYEGLFVGINTSTDESSWSNPYSTAPNHTCFRIYVNGNAKVWVPMALEGAVTRTLGVAIGSSGAIYLSESGANEGLSENTAWLVDSEALVCRGKRGTDGYTITTKHTRGTSAANHTGGTPAYLLQNHVQLLFNDTQPLNLVATGYEPAEYAPCIDGVQSTNTSFVWTGPFIATPTRPMSWRTVLDSSVALSSTISLDNDATNDLTDVTFKDAAVAGSYINRNVIEQRFPVPIKNGATAVTIDEASIPAALSIQHLFTNQDGAEAVIATHRASDSGTAKTITTSALQYRYRIRALNEALVGCETNDATANQGPNGSAGNSASQVFVLDNNALVSAVAIRMRWDTAVDASKTAAIKIVSTTNGAPDPTTTQLVYAQVTGVDISSVFTTGTFTTYTATFAVPAALKAGTYALQVTLETATTHRIDFSAATSAYARGVAYGSAYTASPTSQAPLTDWFRVYGTGTVQIDAVSGTGGTCNLDNIICALDSSSAPQVIFESSDQSIVYLTPTITVQHPAGYGADNSLGLTAVMKVNGNLDIDFDAKTVTNDDTDLTDSSCPYVITSVDELDPYRYEPGTNTVTYAETGQTGSGVDVRSRFWPQYL